MNNNIEKIILQQKKKVAFFVKQGMDSFLQDIIKSLENEYEIKKIIVTEYNQIDEGMEWADICWFEWCDELISYASNLDKAKCKKIICRLHSYEAFTNNIKQVNWSNVYNTILVANHIKYIVESKIGINNEKNIVIPNGVVLENYEFKQREKNFNIAYVGYINYKKGPMLLLHTFKSIYDKDNRFKLYIAGNFQEERYLLYFNKMIKEMGIENNVIYEGWQNDINKWLDDKSYILCTSLLESQNMSVMQAMTKGIKPIIHNFVGAEEIYPRKYLFNTIDEAVDMLFSNEYNSNEYRTFIEENYSLQKEVNSIRGVFDNLYKRDNTEDSPKNVSTLTIEYLMNTINAFFSYDLQYIDKYDFHGWNIKIGKRERLTEYLESVECIIENGNKEKLVLNNISFDKKEQKIYLPKPLINSINEKYINDIISKIISLKVNYVNNISGFIFDKKIVEDIQRNKLAYIWERGIPATQFMPIKSYLRIAERYLFAGNYIKPSDKVLEAACGFGYGAAYLSKICNSVEALDIEKDNIEFAKSAYAFHEINWMIGDVSKLPYKDETFDVYVSFETLEHLPINLVDKYFKEAIRVLRQGGKMIISTPNKYMRENVKNPFHIKEYNFNEFNEMISKYFTRAEYYSSDDYKIQKSMKINAVNMIAICYK